MREIELNEKYRSVDRALASLHRDLQGDDLEQKIPFAATPAVLEQFTLRFEDLKTRVEALEAPDPVYRLMKHHFEDFVDSLHFVLEESRTHPENAMGLLAELLLYMGRNDRRSEAERTAAVKEILNRTADQREEYREAMVFAHKREDYGAVARSLKRSTALLKGEIGRLEEHFAGFTEKSIREMREAGLSCLETMDALTEFFSRDAIKEVPEAYGADDLTITVKMDPELYRKTLKDRIGVSLDEILTWHREEMEKTRAECFHIARGLDIPEVLVTSMKEISEIIFRYEPPCETAQEMFDRCNSYLKRTRAVAHRYVKLPEEEECVCVPIPVYYKDSYPWGGYEGGDFRKPPYLGHMFLNQYNVRNISDSWIKLNALHEAYPGHHVQYVRTATDETAQTVKLGAKLIPLLEGTCLRTETMFQDVFSEDPVFPLFVAYRRHHASTRVHVDLMLYYFGATLEEAVQVYERELGFDRVTARAQVQAHQNAPGYFISYYYGMKKILQWEKAYGFDKKTYTELLFSAGYISIDSFYELVKLSPEERERYYHDFYSR